MYLVQYSNVRTYVNTRHNSKVWAGAQSTHERVGLGARDDMRPDLLRAAARGGHRAARAVFGLVDAEALVALVEQLLVHLHHYLERVVDQAVDRPSRRAHAHTSALPAQI